MALILLLLPQDTKKYLIHYSTITFGYNYHFCQYLYLEHKIIVGFKLLLPTLRQQCQKLIHCLAVFHFTLNKMHEAGLIKLQIFRWLYEVIFFISGLNMVCI